MFNTSGKLAVLILLVVVITVCPVQAAPATEILELNLSESLELALANSLQIKLAQVRLDQAKLQLKETKSGVRKLEEFDDIPGISVPLDFDTNFYKDNGIWLAEQQTALAEAAADLAGEGVRLAVIGAYYDLLKAEADLTVAVAAEKEAEEARRAIAAQAKVGLVTPAQDLAAETGLSQARAGRLGADSARESKRLTFLKELGLSSDTNFVLEMPEQVAADFVLEETMGTVLASSIELRQAQLQHDAADKKFDLMKKWYPDITNQYKDAQYSWLQSELQLADTKVAVETAIHTSYNMVLAAKEQLAPAEKAIEQAAENLRLIEAKLKVGAATGLEVLSAERTLAQAQSNRLGIVQGYSLAVASMEAAQKGLTAGILGARGGGM